MPDHRSHPGDAALVREEAVFFTAGPETLLGFHSRAHGGTEGDPSRLAALILAGGWMGSSAGRNRVMVELARRLAADGIDSFRFDYHGIGESTGSVSKFHLSAPFTLDAEAAAGYLNSQGFDRILLVGSCFGGRTALELARQTPGIVGVALISTPTHDERELMTRAEGGADAVRAGRVRLSNILRVGLRPWMIREVLRRDRREFYVRYLLVKTKVLRSRIASTSLPTGPGDDAGPRPSVRFVRPIRELCARGVAVLFVYGSEDAEWRSFSRIEGELRVIPGYQQLCETLALDGNVHGYGRVSVQTGIVDTIADWAARFAGSDEWGGQVGVRSFR